ncbi:hypothetical protein NpNSSI1_00005148 [Neofusicoccum parvum]|uniref:Uncharacterized protein n=2 Tax=Neofusicoccum parvum TaxID=310453 RepID=R1ERH7_BOTPV|nr:hypothetical protein UCRNP2_2831 [Neofusicoccum parvum UCRNP2]GME33540.1 hypothetical protein NpPPO83_00007610 [Neofusicoccum parvum]GME65731.1 hypothetical protein NpNSSI1_00005148 [Neofusicoccum parvum]
MQPTHLLLTALLAAAPAIASPADNHQAGAAGTTCASNQDCSSYRCDTANGNVCLGYLDAGEQCTFDLNCGGDYVCVTQPESRGVCGTCIAASAHEGSSTLRICRPPDLNPGSGN